MEVNEHSSCEYQKFTLAVIDQESKKREDHKMDYLFEHFESCHTCELELRNIQRDFRNLERLIPEAFPDEKSEKMFINTVIQMQRKFSTMPKSLSFLLLVVKGMGQVLLKPQVVIAIVVSVFLIKYFN